MKPIKTLNMLDLCCGIGGFSFAGRQAGWETRAYCDIDSYCRDVMAKNFPTAQAHTDVKAVEEFDQYAGVVDVVTAGYPCQPFSVAGKRKGEEDERHIWPFINEIIGRVKPQYVVLENVSGHIKLGLDQVCHDLETQGFDTSCYVIPVTAVGGCHKRERVWIVGIAANTNSQSLGMEGCGRSGLELPPLPAGQEVPRRDFAGYLSGDGQDKPRILGSYNGVSGRMDGLSTVDMLIPKVKGKPPRLWKERITALGNAICPAIAYQFFNTINEMERRKLQV